MEVIFNMHKVKYVDLEKMINLKEGNVQIFINVESIVRKLIVANVEDYLKSSTETRMYEFISNVLNIAAHYRKFFSNKNMQSEVILYINDPDSSYNNRMYNDEYRKNTSDLYRATTVFGGFVRDAFPLIKIFTDYIEGVYFITSNRIEPSMVPAILDKNAPNKVLVTTDKYEYQYVNNGFTIIRPKSKGKSYHLNSTNVVDVMKMELNITNPTLVGSNFVPLITSFTGDVRRSIPKIKGVGLSKILNLLSDGIRKGVITINTSNVSLLEDLLSEDIKDVIKTNFMITDVKTQLSSVGKSTKIILEGQKEDKFDDVSLKALSVYFQHYPIMLEELQPMKIKKSVFER